MALIASTTHPAQSDISEISDFVTSTTVTITDVVLALVVVIASWVLARLARRGVRNVLGRVDGISEDVRQLASRVTFYFVLTIGVGIALTFLGAAIQPILTAAIVVGVIALLALRGIAENFAAGMIIQTRRPIEIGDDIDVVEQSGVVREINGRSVVLEGWDRRRIHIPNSTVLNNPLVNHTAFSSRRSEVEVRLSIDEAFDEAVAAVAETIRAVPGVVADPPLEVIYRSVDPQRVVIVVRFAHGPNDSIAVRSAVVRAVAVTERSGGRQVAVTAPPPAVALTPESTI